MGWTEILEAWGLVEISLLETFNIDIADGSFQRPWPWWRDRILSLLSTDSRLSRALGS